MAKQNSNFTGGSGGDTTEASETATKAPRGAEEAVEQTSSSSGSGVSLEEVRKQAKEAEEEANRKTQPSSDSSKQVSDSDTGGETENTGRTTSDDVGQSEPTAPGQDSGNSESEAGDRTPGEITDQEQQDIDAAVAEVNERVREKQQGVETNSGEVATQAQEFEQTVLEENTNLAAEDVRIERDGNTLTATLTPQGAEEVGANKSLSEVAQEVAQETPGVEADDLSVRRGEDSFSVSLTDEAVEERRQQQRDINNELSAPGEIVGDVVDTATDGAGAVGRAVGGVVGSGVGAVFAAPGTTQPESRSRGVRDMAVRVSRQRELLGNPKQTGVSGILNDIGGVETQDLGDTPINNPVTGNRIETDLNRTRDNIGNQVADFRNFSETIFRAGVTNRLYGTDSSNDTQAESFGREVTTRSLTGSATGAVGVIQAPLDTAAAAKEVAETAAFGVGGSGSLTDRGQQIADQGARFGAATAQAAGRRPFEFAAGAVVETAVGGVAGSRFSAATRSGSRAARRAARNTADGLGSRTPTVDIGFNPNAPTFDVTPGAFDAVRRTRDRSSSSSGSDGSSLSQTQGAIQSTLANADLALQGAARRIGEVTSNPGQRVNAGIDRVVNTVVTDPDTQTRTIDVRSPSERISSVAPDTPDVNPGDVRDRVSGAVQGTILSTEAAITNARLRGRAAARRSRERATPDSSPSDVADQVTGAVQGGVLSAEAAVTNARRSARSRIPERPQRPTLPNTPGVSDVQGVIQGGILSAEAAVTNARRGLSTADVSLPNLPSGSSGGGPRLRDLSIRVGPPRPNRQGQQVLDVTGLDDVDVDVSGEFDGDGDSGTGGGISTTDFDTPDTSGGRGGSDAIDTTRTGTGTDQVTLELGDTRTRSTDFDSQTPGFDLGSGLAAGLLGGQGARSEVTGDTPGEVFGDTNTGPGEVQRPRGRGGLDFDIGPVGLPDFDVGVPSTNFSPPRQDQRQPPRRDQRQPPRRDQRQPPRFDIDQPPQIDLDTPEQPDQRTPRTPDVPGTPNRPRVDVEFDGGDSNRRRRDDVFGGDEQRFEYETLDLL